MKKSAKIILIILAAVIVLAAAAIFAFYIRVNDPANVFGGVSGEPIGPIEIETPEATDAPAPEATFSPIEETPGEPTPVPTPTPIPESVLQNMSDAEFMKNRVNILVLGIDRSVERLESGSFRSDTIILVSVNFKTLEVDMISVPRDTYVKLYNRKGELIDEAAPYNKVNAAFSLGGGVDKGGYQSEMNTISALMGGIPVSYYVGFDMNAVKLIVDAMGGVDYEVDIDVSMNGRELHPGMQHLDGQAVLDYCRQRKGSSDVARADRQQRMLMAIFNQMKSTGQIANIPEIYKAVSDSIDTDLSFEQICSLALIALRMDFDQLERHMVEGKFESIYERDCWLVYNDKLQKLVKTVFGAEVEFDPAMDHDTLIAAVAANHEALSVELYNAAVLYNECKAFMDSYKSAIPATTYSALSKSRSELATYVRLENKAYLDYYTALLDGQLTAAYQEIGLARPAPAYAGAEPVTGGGSESTPEILTGYDAILAAGEDDE